MRVPACADVCTWARARDVAVLAAVAESEGSLFLAMQSAVEVMRDSDRLIGNAKFTPVGGDRPGMPHIEPLSPSDHSSFWWPSQAGRSE
jgi:hypothetical protein